MADTITRGQLEALKFERDFALSFDDFHALLEKYTGITAKPCTRYMYFDSSGNYLGNDDDSDVEDLLREAYIKVEDRISDSREVAGHESI